MFQTRRSMKMNEWLIVVLTGRVIRRALQSAIKNQQLLLDPVIFAA